MIWGRRRPTSRRHVRQILRTQYATPYASRRGLAAVASVPDGATWLVCGPPKVAVQPWITRGSWPRPPRPEPLGRTHEPGDR